jgi:hypothetical protein
MDGRIGDCLLVVVVDNRERGVSCYLLDLGMGSLNTFLPMTISTGFPHH